MVLNLKPGAAKPLARLALCLKEGLLSLSKSACRRFPSAPVWLKRLGECVLHLPSWRSACVGRCYHIAKAITLYIPSCSASPGSFADVPDVTTADPHIVTLGCSLPSGLVPQWLFIFLAKHTCVCECPAAPSRCPLPSFLCIISSRSRPTWCCTRCGPSMVTGGAIGRRAAISNCHAHRLSWTDP